MYIYKATVTDALIHKDKLGTTRLKVCLIIIAYPILFQTVVLVRTFSLIFKMY